MENKPVSGVRAVGAPDKSLWGDPTPQWRSPQKLNSFACLIGNVKCLILHLLKSSVRKQSGRLEPAKNVTSYHMEKRKQAAPQKSLFPRNDSKMRPKINIVVNV